MFSRDLKKLNLGCGFDKRDGYLNVDINSSHNPDVTSDVLKLDFLPKKFYEEIIAHDVLEHLPRTSTRRALLHWASLLQLGGKLSLRVPSVLLIAKALNHPNNQTLELQELWIQSLFGTQAYSGDFHFTTFTEVILRSYLSQTGFQVTKFAIQDGWIFDVLSTKTNEVTANEIDDFSELLEKSFSDEEFIEDCYAVILNRAPDSEGLHFYTNQLKTNVMSRDQVISVFTSSNERKRKDLSEQRT